MTHQKSRGRVESRTLTTLTARDVDWPGAKQLLRLERMTIRNGQQTTTVSYAITSLDRRRCGPDELLGWLRGRWDIENRIFWVRDVIFGEDRCTVRYGQLPLVLAHLRNAVINVLRTTGATNIAAALRYNALKVNELLTQFAIVNY